MQNLHILLSSSNSAQTWKRQEGIKAFKMIKYFVISGTKNKIGFQLRCVFTFLVGFIGGYQVFLGMYLGVWTPQSLAIMGMSRAGPGTQIQRKMFCINMHEDAKDSSQQ